MYKYIDEENENIYTWLIWSVCNVILLHTNNLKQKTKFQMIRISWLFHKNQIYVSISHNFNVSYWCNCWCELVFRIPNIFTFIDEKMFFFSFSRHRTEKHRGRYNKKENLTPRCITKFTVIQQMRLTFLLGVNLCLNVYKEFGEMWWSSIQSSTMWKLIPKTVNAITNSI